VECWVPAGRVSRTPRGPGFRKPPVRLVSVYSDFAFHSPLSSFYYPDQLFSFRYSVSVIQFPLSSFRHPVSVIQFPSSSSTIQIQSFTSGQCTILLSFSLRYPESVVQFPLFSIRISVSLFDSVILIQLLDFCGSALGLRLSVQLPPILVLVLLGSLPAIVRIRHGKMFRSCFSGMWSLPSPWMGPVSLLGHGDPNAIPPGEVVGRLGFGSRRTVSAPCMNLFPLFLSDL